LRELQNTVLRISGDEMGRVSSTLRRDEKYTTLENRNGRDHLEVLCLDGKIVVEIILGK
jgi:hypothetical protein